MQDNIAKVATWIFLKSFENLHSFLILANFLSILFLVPVFCKKAITNLTILFKKTADLATINNLY